MGMLRTLKLAVILVALAAGGLAVWRRREAVKSTWDSLGGAEGIKDTADRLIKTAGPVKDLVDQLTHLK
jgi:hypothetical protein